LDAEWAANIDGILSQVGYQVDPITYRDLFGPQGLMPIRTRDVINALVNREFVPSDREDSQIQSILKKLKTDLSNADEIIETLRGSFGKRLEQNLRNDMLAFNESGLDRVLASTTDEEGNEITEVENLQGENLSNWLADQAVDLGVEYIAPIDILNGDVDLSQFSEDSQKAIEKFAKQAQAVFGENVDLSTIINLESPESFNAKLATEGHAL